MFYLPQLFFLLILSSCKKNQPISHEIIDFDKHYFINSVLKDDTLTVTIKLDDMLHAYAEGEKVGRPVALSIKNHNGWQALGPSSIPKGSKKNLSGLGESITLEKEIEIKQKVIVGKGQGEAVLNLQVCSHNSCDRPKEHIILLGN